MQVCSVGKRRKKSSPSFCLLVRFSLFLLLFALCFFPLFEAGGVEDILRVTEKESGEVFGIENFLFVKYRLKPSRSQTLSNGRTMPYLLRTLVTDNDRSIPWKPMCCDHAIKVLWKRLFCFNSGSYDICLIAFSVKD